jgi:hypothetical protein
VQDEEDEELVEKAKANRAKRLAVGALHLPEQLSRW